MELPGYRIERLIAHGRRGPIHRGDRLADGQAVAVQSIHTELDRPRRGRFRTESDALLRLPSSPHLHPVLDAGLDPDGLPYLVTPLAEHALGDRLAGEGPLDVDEVTAAGVAAACGLRDLHAAGRLHGNVTPGNLLVVSGGEIRLTGMAVAVLAEVDTAGNGAHHPPEVLEGGEWTVAGDLYALAHTLFTLLDGVPPYGSPDAADRLVRVRTARIPELRRRDVPDALRAALRHALDPHPAARPGSAAEFVAALERAIPGPAARVATEPPPVPTGRPFGSRYVLQEPIGRGAMGEVWRGADRLSGQPVAIKLLNRQFAARMDFLTRFLNEGKILSTIGHAHLVRVHDVVAEGGDYGLVMDLIEGEDLRHVTTAAPLSLSDACTVLAQVSSALAAVHTAGVVHRDVKPENILVERTPGGPHARLADFGIAKTDTGLALTLPGTGFMGTVEYGAPEVIRGSKATPAADVYALGIVGYELFELRRPDEARQRYGSGAAGGPPEPERMPAEVWEHLRPCLAADPERRPSAEELARALLPLAGLLPTGTPAAPPLPPPASPRLQPPAVHPPTAAAVAGAAVAAAGAVAGDHEAAAPPITFTLGAARRGGRAGGPKPPSSPPAAVRPPAPLPAGRGRRRASAVRGRPSPLPTAAAEHPLPEPPPEPPPPRRRRRRLVAVLAAAALIGGIVGVVFQLTRPDTTPRQVPVKLVVLSDVQGAVEVRLLPEGGLQAQSYVIYYGVDGGPKSPWPRSPQDSPELTHGNLDPAAEYCYLAEAQIPATDATTTTTYEDVCLHPDGQTEPRESPQGSAQ